MLFDPTGYNQLSIHFKENQQFKLRNVDLLKKKAQNGRKKRKIFFLFLRLVTNITTNKQKFLKILVGPSAVLILA